MLSYLSIGTAYSEPKINERPYKVCPEIVTKKDVPCKTIPITAIVSRQRVEDVRNEEIDRLKAMIRELEAIIKELKKEE